MFGLTKREQRWKAEQKAAETIASVLVAAVNAKSHKGEEMNKAEELIACLEVEIAKRDARIVELHADLSGCRERAGVDADELRSLRAELAAIKAQEPDSEDWGVFAAYLLDNCEREVIYEESLQRWVADMIADPHYGPLFRREAAPVAEAKAQGVVMPELSAAEREDLLEFHQSVCCDAGHRVDKSGMKRLSEIGAVESCGFGKHRMTEFGVYLLGLNAAPVQQAKCVHTEHCCVEHGCKYGHDDCPVVSGLKNQSYPCESCAAPAAPAADAGLVYCFECREIGESDWVACDYPRYLYCQNSPEMDTRVVLAAHRSQGVV